MKKIGILTGGGDCPGLNAVIRAAVKTAVMKYNLKVVGIADGFSGLLNGHFHELTISSVSGILPRGGTILGTSNRDNPFNFAVSENGKIAYYDMSDRCIQNLEKEEIDALIVIGGDGSLSIAKEFSAKGVKIIGVPKTIDNDLSATDTTFGFDTALVTATEAIDKLHTTAESHHRVMVLEVMGRYAGWIAIQAGIAGGADVILIPEIPFKIEKVVESIQKRKEHGKKFSIVVVAEGAKHFGGEIVVQQIIEGSADPIRLGGIGNVVGKEIEKITNTETRVTVLGHLQRGGSPTPFDRILATRYGQSAVECLMQGQFGCMVALKTPLIKPVPLAEAVQELRMVPSAGQLVNTARCVGISFGD